MKPVSVRFRCFGPYMVEQYIDFEQLREHHLFLICGETGAGKTTILDAICYALYARSSGGLRGDLAAMRCKLAGKDDETLVEFTFDVNGKRYRFLRSLKYGRKNLNDSHNCMVLADGVFVPIFENPKLKNVNEKAEELIGLTYEQFRQVIILPQGQFEKLLVSDSAEKEKILVSLFHADRWQRITDELYRRVTERDTALRLEKARLTAKLNSFGCETLEQLDQQLAQKASSLAALEQQVQAAEVLAAQRRKEKEAALLENRDFQELHRREARFAALKVKEAAGKQEEAALALAEQADMVTPQYRSYMEQKRQLLEVRQAVLNCTQEKAGAERALMKVREEKAAHEKIKPEQDDKKRQILLLESRRTIYDALDEALQASVKANQRLLSAQAQFDKTRQHFDVCTEQWHRRMGEQADVISQYQAAQEQYRQSIGGILAKELRSGIPCPVCGSVTHPAPAHPAADHISEAALDTLNRGVAQASKLVSQSMNQRALAENEMRTAQLIYEQAAQEAALAGRDYENAVAGKVPGIENRIDLESRITSLQRALRQYETQEAALTEKVTSAQAHAQAMEAALLRLQNQEVNLASQTSHREKLWLEALAASGFKNEGQFHAASMEPEERLRRSSALSRFQAELAASEAALKEQKLLLGRRVPPDLDKIDKALQTAQELYSTRRAELLILKGHVTAMKEALRLLTGSMERYATARQSVDADLEFSTRLRGSSGISLQRYVLGVMLTSITAQANRLLRSVYGGRYQLYRTDDVSGSGRKSGLELEVYDSSNSQRRSVTTLSGGEKFLMALSLAIGLSTVVQAQSGGIRLEAMFIDEGFGSLDTASITDALEVLQSIGRANTLVGIISHVEQLSETIPTKIKITKGARGSQCQLCL